GIDQSLYIGGNSRGGDDCLSHGNTHSDILIESNVFDQTDSDGQTDQIVLNAGLTNVTIRHNTLNGGRSGSNAITSLGVIPGMDNVPSARTDYLIEGNVISNRRGGAIDQLLNQNGTVIRNNLIYNNSSGIVLSGSYVNFYPYTYNANVE